MPKTGCDDSLAFLEVIRIRETRDHGVRLIRDRTRVRRSRAADADLELAHAGAAAEVRAPAVLSGLRLAFAFAFEADERHVGAGPLRRIAAPPAGSPRRGLLHKTSKAGASTRTR